MTKPLFAYRITVFGLHAHIKEKGCQCMVVRTDVSVRIQEWKSLMADIAVML